MELSHTAKHTPSEFYEGPQNNDVYKFQHPIHTQTFAEFLRGVPLSKSNLFKSLWLITSPALPFLLFMRPMISVAKVTIWDLWESWNKTPMCHWHCKGDFRPHTWRKWSHLWTCMVFFANGWGRSTIYVVLKFRMCGIVLPTIWTIFRSTVIIGTKQLTL